MGKSVLLLIIDKAIGFILMLMGSGSLTVENDVFVYS